MTKPVIFKFPNSFLCFRIDGLPNASTVILLLFDDEAADAALPQSQEFVNSRND